MQYLCKMHSFVFNRIWIWTQVGFGQTVCTPLRPRCGICSVSDFCPSAFKETPSPSSKKKTRNKLLWFFLRRWVYRDYLLFFVVVFWCSAFVLCRVLLAYFSSLERNCFASSLFWSKSLGRKFIFGKGTCSDFCKNCYCKSNFLSFSPKMCCKSSFRWFTGFVGLLRCKEAESFA